MLQSASVALLADIQGNALALEAVLANITQHRIDAILCLGDLFSGPEPSRVMDLLRQHAITCVQGNMDQVILNPPSTAPADPVAANYHAMDGWCHQQLTRADRHWLHTLPRTATFAVGELTGLACHGSPTNAEFPLDASTPARMLATLVANLNTDILATGHMHHPFCFHSGRVTIINPGSIGLPFGGRQPMPTQASYATLHAERRELRVKFHTIAYDPAEFRRRVLTSGLPHAEWFLSQWIL